MKKMNRPRMLVTGGSGYLGRWVARLACADWDVSATYLTHPMDQPGATWRRLDLRDEATVAALVDEVRPAAIIHTAACNPGSGDDFEASNTTGTRHIARAAEDCSARLVHLSSDVIFDGQRGNYVERDPPAPITAYARSKALAEAEVHASGADVAIVRTSLIYGWRPSVDRHTRWIVDGLNAGEPVRLFTDEFRCPVWVENLAAAVIELASMNYRGVLHVAGAQPLSRYEFGVRLLRFHGLDPRAAAPALSREIAPGRPLDCTLDCSRARSLLHTPLPGVDEVLAQGREKDRLDETARR